MNNVLMYHSIGKQLQKEKGSSYSVSPEQFRKQMKYITQMGTVPLGDSPHLVSPNLVTFDDGDITNYEYAYPILKELGLKAYFFVIVDKIDTDGYMDWEQLKDMDRNGMIIGSHGMTHAILTELNNKKLEYEIITSKRHLEYQLGHRIDYFSVAKGYYNNKVLTKLKEAGYKKVFTSNPDDNDGFKCGRIAVKSDWDLLHFKKVINGGLPVRDKIMEFAKSSSKKILGANLYDKLRNKVLK